MRSAIHLALAASCLVAVLVVARAGAAPSDGSFDDVYAEAVLHRLHPDAVVFVDRDAEAAKLVASDRERALTAKLPAVKKGANPFEGGSDPLDVALAAVCAVEQVAGGDDPATGIEQRKRMERALDAARNAHASVLTAYCLGWLGVYEMQGGDTAAARRYLTEATGISEAASHVRLAVASRRNIANCAALEGDSVAALQEGTKAAQLLESLKAAPSDRLRVGLPLYAELVEYAIRAGSVDAASGFAKTRAELLESSGASREDAAEAFERLAQLRAQATRTNRQAAKGAADAFARASEHWAAAKQPDRQVLDLTAAGVLLVENATGAEARPLLDRALEVAIRIKSPSLAAGVEYWIGRSWLSDARRATSAPAQHAAYERAYALFGRALARIEPAPAKPGPAGDNRALAGSLHLWMGKALLDDPRHSAKRLADAGIEFRAAFAATLAAGDVNEAVGCAELVIRVTAETTASLEPNAGASRAAIDAFDRLADSGKIDPLNAADALGRALTSSLMKSHTGVLPNGVVGFYDHVSVALAAAPNQAGVRAEALLVRSAADSGDARVIRERGERTIDALVSAGRKVDAEELAVAIATLWAVAGDAALATSWSGRAVALAKERYRVAVEAGRLPDAASAAADISALSKQAGDAAEAPKWAVVAADLRGQIAKDIEASGKTGLAFGAWSAAGDASARAGDNAAARDRFNRAVTLATESKDRRGRAQALTGRARAELALGDSAAARTSASEAVSILDELRRGSTDELVKGALEADAAAAQRVLDTLSGP